MASNYEIIEKLIPYLKENYNIDVTIEMNVLYLRTPSGGFYSSSFSLKTIDEVYERINKILSLEKLEKIEKVGGSNYEFLERFNSYLLKNYSIKLSTIRETLQIPNSRDNAFRDYFFLAKSDNTWLTNYIYIPVEDDFEEQCYKIINNYLNDRSREISES